MDQNVLNKLLPGLWIGFSQLHDIIKKKKEGMTLWLLANAS